MVVSTVSRAARDAALDRVEQAHPSDTDRVRAVIRRLASECDRFTADDVRAALDFDPASAAVVGAAFMHMARAKEIHKVGQSQSARKNQHAAALPYWSAKPVAPVAPERTDGSKIEQAARRARLMLKSGNHRGALAALDSAFGG